MNNNQINLIASNCKKDHAEKEINIITVDKMPIYFRVHYYMDGERKYRYFHVDDEAQALSFYYNLHE